MAATVTDCSPDCADERPGYTRTDPRPGSKDGTSRTGRRDRGRRARVARRFRERRLRKRSTGQVVVISGLSGAGKSQASKLFEDLGYYCVDNLPPELLDAFLSLRDADPARYDRIALVLDIRAGDPAPADRGGAHGARRRVASTMQVLYLEASDANLVSRFSETRHRHPLQTRSGVQAGIAEERRRLARTRELADHVIDTSGLSIGQLKERLFAYVPRDGAAGELQVDIITFGFKYGIPLEADLVFDVRFLTNPFWVPDLKPLSGLQPRYATSCSDQPAAGRFLDLVVELLELTVPAYRAEGQERLDGRPRLHRRLPPLDRPGRGAGRAAPRDRRGIRDGLPSGAGAMKVDRPSALAVPGHAPQALAGAPLPGYHRAGLGAAILVVDCYRRPPQLLDDRRPHRSRAGSPDPGRHRHHCWRSGHRHRAVELMHSVVSPFVAAATR